MRKEAAMFTMWREYAAIPLRIALGLIFFVHGARTLLGIFGGTGLARTGDYLASYGIVPGELWAVIAGFLGLFGGISLLIGLLTRWVAGALAIEMVVSLVAINLRAGFSATNGGVEFPLILLAGLLSLMLLGPQHYAVDEHLPGWSGDLPSPHSRAHA
jgi:putative oxidoreductase